MKIGIIGVGVVGSANRAGFEYLGHTVLVHDIKLGTSIDDIKDTEIAFICVPTPSKESGECDTSIVESVLAKLSTINYLGIVAIRSTSIPGFTNRMIEKFQNLTICFVPELLRERCAIDDFINDQTLLAVGTYDDWVFKKLVVAHGPLPKNIVRLSPTEAELMKYYNNVYASLRIVFANIMYEISEKLNCDYTKIKDAYVKTGKTTDLYLDVSDKLRGYGGMCLPKDTKALTHLIKSLELNFELIDAIENDNKKFPKTVFNKMRS